MKHSLVLLGIIVYLGNALGQGPVIETSLGKVRGTTGESRDGRTFHQFLGIPYGKAKRFMAPKEADPWSEIREATNPGAVCPQFEISLRNDQVLIGSEDCLNLNVYSPKVPEKDQAKVLLPVIVAFHGGGGDFGGAGLLGSEYFMDANTVMVTFNARLGALGYLNLGTELASGNQRLKDEVLMLKWVKKNIENFGGDPDRITACGVESGASEVGYHMISSRSKGLISGAITLDGGVLTPNMFIHKPLKEAKKVGLVVGCPIDSKQALYDCLMGKGPEEMVFKFHRWTSEISDEEFLNFGPSMENLSNPDTFLTENPYIMLQERNIGNQVPWIDVVSYNPGFYAPAFYILTQESQRKKLNEQIFKILPRYLSYENTANDSTAVTKKIIHKYFNDQEITEENAWEFANIISDRFFFLPCLTTENTYYKYAPTYVLIMSYIPAISLTDILGYSKKVKGANADALSCLFNLGKLYGKIDTKSPDYEFSKKFVQLLASFVENGRPTKTWGDINEWRRKNAEENPPIAVHIEENGKMSTLKLSNEHISRIGFWQDLFKTELASELLNALEETF